jgi:diguanylate cyclase (GGDEF)-like protein
LRNDGSTLPVEVTVGVTGVRSGRLIHAFARDISARVEEEEASRAHLGDLDRLLAVARDLGRPGSAGDGRDAICHAARELAHADSALFFEIRPSEGMLVATGTSRSSDEGRSPGRVTLDMTHSLTARILVSSEPTFVGDLQRDARVDHETAAQLGVRAAYWQPVTRDGMAIGVLVVYWRQPQPEVSARIRSILELFATQAAVVVERSDLMSRLESLARTDPLTGLANRRALDEALVRDLAAAERTARPISVVMLDLDHFKRYNDTRGHQAGDALLHDAAGAWARELRASDTVARYGGEEFLVVLPACDTGGAVEIADRLREMVPGDETASAGVAAWHGTETMAALIARADAALYEAKRRGRNRVAVDRPQQTASRALPPEASEAARTAATDPG